MINKVAFTGREEMLINPLEKVAKKAETYIESSSILPELPKIKISEAPIPKPAYTSPFAPINAGKKLSVTI